MPPNFPFKRIPLPQGSSKASGFNQLGPKASRKQRPQPTTPPPPTKSPSSVQRLQRLQPSTPISPQLPKPELNHLKSIKPLIGRVLKGRTTTLPNTIKVSITDPPNTKYHPILRKPVNLKPRTVLVNDPTRSCIEGDVVSVVGGKRSSTAVHYTVERVVAPFGGWAIGERPLMKLKLDQKMEERMGEEGGGGGWEGG